MEPEYAVPMTAAVRVEVVMLGIAVTTMVTVAVLVGSATEATVTVAVPPVPLAGAV